VLLLGFSCIIPIALAIFAVLVIGLCKEFWDKYYGTGFGWYDIQANLIGVYLGLIVKILLTVSISEVISPVLF